MMPVHACSDCDGRGGAHEVEDGDEYGGMSVWWRCEGCDASGLTTSCCNCGDPMPMPEAEANAYRCPACVADGEYQDREAMAEQLRRM